METIKYHYCNLAKRWSGSGFCCSSCHEDADYYPMGDYPLCELQIGKHYFIVCCGMLGVVSQKYDSVKR